MTSLANPEEERLALVDLLDRLMTGGVVVTGDVMLSIAGVDLVYLGLRLVLTSVDGLSGPARGAHGPSGEGQP
jgi:hypothetical protein